MKVSPNDVTGLLQAWSEGDESVQQHLADLVYLELKRRARLVKDRSHEFVARSLVHDVFVYLVKPNRVPREARTDFCALAAPMIRRIVMEDARSRHTPRRIGSRRTWILMDTAIYSNDRSAEFVAFDDALNLLARIDSVKCEIVELHFFGGLSIEEIAWKLQLSSIAVQRDWNVAKAWLEHEVQKRGTTSFLRPLHRAGTIGADLMHQLSKRKF